MNEGMNIDIEEILGNVTPMYVPIEKLVTGVAQARQTGTKVEKDAKLVSQIRKAGGLLHPIIVKDLQDGTYEIIVGQRRVGAYHILKEEDSKFEKIRAYVVERGLSNDEIRVISFIENFGRDDMDRVDYINVIEYFYQKYGGNKSMTARALGISINHVTTYLTHARLSDRVKECITSREFSINTAIQALKGLGDDEASVDDDLLIETAKELHKAKPAVRKKAVQRMQGGKVPVKEAIGKAGSTVSIQIEVTDDQVDKLGSYKDKHSCESIEDAAMRAMDVELDRDEKQ